MYQLHINIFLVDSNDKLYGADKKFIAETIKIVDTILKEILEELKELGEKVNKIRSVSTFQPFCLLNSSMSAFWMKKGMESTEDIALGSRRRW